MEIHMPKFPLKFCFIFFQMFYQLGLSALNIYWITQKSTNPIKQSGQCYLELISTCFCRKLFPVLLVCITSDGILFATNNSLHFGLSNIVKYRKFDTKEMNYQHPFKLKGSRFPSETREWDPRFLLDWYILMRFMYIMNTDKNPGGLHEEILFCLCFFSFRFGVGFYLNSSRCSGVETKSGSSYSESFKLYFLFLC